MENRTVNGTMIGDKGEATRAALLEAFRGLLGVYPLHAIRVRDITDVSGHSPATFWRYFVDLDSVIRLLAAEATGNKLWERQVKHAAQVLKETAH